MKRQTSLFFNNRWLLTVALSSTAVITCQATTSLSIANEVEIKDSQVATATDKKLLNKALQVIQKTMNRAKTTGTPYLVSCRYKIKGDKPVAASTEVRYSDYRKTSDSRSVEISPFEGKIDRVVDFTYKPKSQRLAVVDRDPENLAKCLVNSKTVHQIKI